MVGEAVRAAIAAGELPDVAVPGAAVERPKDATHGDYASALALRLSRAAMKPPMEVAATIAAHIEGGAIVDKPEIVPPGFINLRLSDAFLQDWVLQIVTAGPTYADLDLGAGRLAQVEFVSANPTGPLHVGNGRGAAIGDTLAATLSAAGYVVSREYYVNDAGAQTETFGRTLYARYQSLFGREAEVPADGYPGEYIVDLAREIANTRGESLLETPREDGPAELTAIGIDLMVESIRRTLEKFGVHYDRWFREKELFESGGAYEKALGILRERGFLADREGAIWFTSSDLGEDKDNVVIRSDGRPTYFASDIAYHYDKFVTRGNSLVIDVWGADHHGHVSRVKTAAQAVGSDPDALHVLLYQLVVLKRGGETVRLSKRGGDIITLDELIDEVGPDAARFFFLMRSPASQMEFDVDLAIRRSNDNPVFYVQYAHARLAGILNRAREAGLSSEGGDVRLLTEPHELDLIREMLKLSDVIELVATTFEPQHLPHYATALATAFHAFNDAFKQAGDPSLKVITDDEPRSRARLQLVTAARVALGRVLELMGMHAPEHM